MSQAVFIYSNKENSEALRGICQSSDVPVRFSQLLKHFAGVSSHAGVLICQILESPGCMEQCFSKSLVQLDQAFADTCIYYVSVLQRWSSHQWVSPAVSTYEGQQKPTGTPQILGNHGFWLLEVFLHREQCSNVAKNRIFLSADHCLLVQHLSLPITLPLLLF